MTGNIVWIASYPKSGNTWFRAFITNLVAESGSPAPINRLLAENGNARSLFDAATGIDSAHLFPEEVDSLRPDMYDKISASSHSPCFLKIHAAYQTLPDGQPVFPTEATRCTIYLARNPLDAACSYARFLNLSLDSVIAKMNEDGHVFNRERSDMSNALSQRIFNWSENVLSWLDAPAGMKVHLICYEDMLRHPEETFSQAARAIGLDKNEEEIRRAIAFSSFDILKEMEDKAGFKEKPPQADAFFHAGKSGRWREILSRDQATAIVEKHKAVMQRLGYLDADGNILDL